MTPSRADRSCGPGVAARPGFFLMRRFSCRFVRHFRRSFVRGPQALAPAAIRPPGKPQGGILASCNGANLLHASPASTGHLVMLDLRPTRSECVGLVNLWEEPSRAGSALTARDPAQPEPQPVRRIAPPRERAGESTSCAHTRAAVNPRSARAAHIRSRLSSVHARRQERGSRHCVGDQRSPRRERLTSA
jgi:hypothetical protein